MTRKRGSDPEGSPRILFNNQYVTVDLTKIKPKYSAFFWVNLLIYNKEISCTGLQDTSERQQFFEKENQKPENILTDRVGDSAG